jgi:saccharopine dehydrogenase-like NADP-dependent oxidoreductase
MKKEILLFGAGKSASVLIDYLITESTKENWSITIVDANEDLILQKTKQHIATTAVVLDIEKDNTQRQQLIQKAAIVISLLPPHLHILVAKDCIAESKNLLTASYIDAAIKNLEKEIIEKDLLFLCEMGLDPGIDHMSAMQLIHNIKKDGGIISSFKSHCGGLVAPESDDNPWHYKISWNPRNIINAGKAGAEFLLNGASVKLDYLHLFQDPKLIFVEGLDTLSYYPNRDSLSYIPIYQLEGVHTFIRTTLRHPDFMYGWGNIIELQLTNEEKIYETDGKNLSALFKEHLDKQNFGEWITQKMSGNLASTKILLEQLNQLLEAEEEAKANGEPIDEDFMTVNKDGALVNLELKKIKTTGAEIVAHQMHQNNLTLKLLFFLGLDDEATMVNKGLCSIADILQFALEQKLKLQATDKDMIVMQHEIEYIANHKKNQITSSLVVKGEDAVHTAMAKTVGLPLGIAAKFILNGTIKLKGLHIPIKSEIYEPVLKELEKNGVVFQEQQEVLA